MADYPDVLDSMGKTPREFGALHVHLEALHAVDGDRYVVSVLLQGAFDPMPTARLDFVSPTGAQLLSVDIPALEGGRVLRLRAPLRSRGPLQRVGMSTDCASALGSRRVRPAWKLLDTVEIPTLSEMDPSDVDAAQIEAFSNATFLGPRTAARMLSGSDALSVTVRTTVHKARELPSVLWVDLTTNAARPMSEPEFEVVWAVGQKVPAAPPIVPIQQSSSKEVRWCRTCAWEAKPGEHLTARSCPNCDATWF